MATYKNGISGAFSGKLGPVVGSSFRGLNVMRAKPRKTTKKPTAAQLEQRARFAAVNYFLSPANSILSQYFGEPEGNKSRCHLATSHHLHNAVHWDGTKAHILYQKALFAKGDLLGFKNLIGIALPATQLQLTWENSTEGNALATDELMVLAIAPSFDCYELFSEVSTRSTGSATLSLPPFLSGNHVHCWAFAVSAEGRLNSTSVYLGNFVL